MNRQSSNTTTMNEIYFTSSPIGEVKKLFRRIRHIECDNCDKCMTISTQDRERISVDYEKSRYTRRSAVPCFKSESAIIATNIDLTKSSEYFIENEKSGRYNDLRDNIHSKISVDFTGTRRRSAVPSFMVPIMAE
jgi:hypothetical protein